MKDSRKRCFFWLGVFILPLFWSWFTLARSFTRRERAIAFLWLAVFVIWLFQQRGVVVDQWQMASIVYPAFLGWLTIALAVWLLFRIRFIPTIIEIIVLTDLLAIHPPSTLFSNRIGQPFDWLWLALPLAFALAHFAVEPLHRCRIRRSA